MRSAWQITQTHRPSRLLGLMLGIMAASFAICCSAANPDFETQVQPFLDEHCVRCHNADRQRGDFRIDDLSHQVGLVDTPLWAEVMERISSGEMPPEDEEQRPTAVEGAAIVEWLSDRIEEGKATRLASKDRVSYHRLSREEYVNTIRDLIGVEFVATDPGRFTEDSEYHGFERIGSVLTLSASHIEKYFEAAESILDEAYPDKPPKPIDLERLAVDPNRFPESQLDRLKRSGADHFRFELWPQAKFTRAQPGILPISGIYEMSITLSGLKPRGGRAPRLHIYHEELDRVLFSQDVVAPENEPITVKFRTHLPAGYQRIVVWNDVPGPSNLPRSGRHGLIPFISTQDGRQPWQLKMTDESGLALYPFLMIDKVAWRGPIVSEHQANLRAEYLPIETVERGVIKKSLATFAKRAFRRPLRHGEIDQYLAIVENERDAGEKFLPSIKAAMLAILCSKSFLFLEEGSLEQDRLHLNDWEIASRLSYFLSSSMPDQELFSLAESGALQEPEVLRKQVTRMLADIRSRRFANSFSHQWLRLKKVGMFPPDKKQFPHYDAYLEQSMIGETLAFFAEVLDRNLSLRELIDSNWTMLNARLAAHYGIPGVETDSYERVSLHPEYHRGGMLTQASILSLTSDGTRHRPVHRGVWISETILGKTPPPPPANVDPVEPNPINSPKATFRDKLEAHKADANCASCHKKIDPYGLAFENFDAIGSWRTKEAVQTGIGENPNVDPSGVLPDGRAFANLKEFKRLLLADIDVFHLAFIKKLATYGLRRSLTIDDYDDLAKIAATSKASDYRLRAIIEAFVMSDLFGRR